MEVYCRTSQLSHQDDFKTGHHEIQLRYRLAERDGLDVDTLQKVLAARMKNSLRDALEAMGYEVTFQEEPAPIPAYPH